MKINKWNSTDYKIYIVKICYLQEIRYVDSPKRDEYYFREHLILTWYHRRIRPDTTLTVRNVDNGPDPIHSNS